MTAAPAPRPGTGSSGRLFVERFLANPSGVSAVWPSSRWLARAMVGDLMPKPGQVVLEYGPGTGPMTRILASRIGEGVRYVGIEADPGFCAWLRREFPAALHPGMEFVHDSVENVERILGERGLGRPDFVASGLPLGSMPEQVVREILTDVARLLRPGGIYRSFSYIHFAPLPGGRRLRRIMREVFDETAFDRPVLFNVPPGYVLTGRRADP